MKTILTILIAGLTASATGFFWAISTFVVNRYGPNIALRLEGHWKWLQKYLNGKVVIK
jgi:hypothetical protein